MVTKYNPVFCKSPHIVGNMEEDTDGAYILASDYAALEAELARVKAESLRVVKDGEKCWLDDAGSEAAIYYDSVTDSNYILILTGSGTFLLTGEKIELGKDAPVQPVRLERWEDEG